MTGLNQLYDLYVCSRPGDDFRCRQGVTQTQPWSMFINDPALLHEHYKRISSYGQRLKAGDGNEFRGIDSITHI